MDTQIPFQSGLNSSGQYVTTQMSYNNSPARTIQTVAAAANGWQISTSRNAEVRYSITITGTATISGAVTGTAVLEICATNSATATDWIEVSRIAQGQSFGVVIGISCTQVITASVRGAVPAGYWVRVRSINTTGTPTFALNSGQEVTL